MFGSDLGCVCVCVCVCVCACVRAGEGRGATITDRYVHQSVECQYKSQFLVLRQDIDGLTAVIRRELGIDPFQKNVLFMFCGRKPDKIKCLIWEGDGFPLLYKRLLDGRYQWPRTKQEVMEMTQEQFEWLMSGQTIIAVHTEGQAQKYGI